MIDITPKQFNSLRCLVVGDVMLDRYWFGDVQRISPEAPVPVLAVNKEECRAGGAANVAHNLLALGGQCTLLSVVGKDAAGTDIRRIIEGYGAQCHLLEDDSISTIVKLRMLAQNQQLLRADFEAKPSDEVLQQCMQGYLSELGCCDVVILSDYGKGGLRHVSDMVAAAKEQGVPVIIDPKGEDYSGYYGASLITPNMKELAAVVGKMRDEAEFKDKAVQLCKDLNLNQLLVTRSEKGMALFDQEGFVAESPARALEVYDVSGAGDTVIALMALMSLSSYSNIEKLELANTVAGIVVGKLGTAVASIEEVIANIQ